MIVLHIFASWLALNSQFNLQRSGRKSASALERLSSGLRINKAADDAAGLAISEKMRGQIRGLAQASRNVQDGISYVQTADGGLGSIQEPPLKRLRELAVKAANDTLSAADRRAIQQEINAINDEIMQMVRGTDFGDQRVIRDVFARQAVINGSVDISRGVSIIAGINDSLNFVVDGQQVAINLDAGQYSADDFVFMLNEKLWSKDPLFRAALNADGKLQLTAYNHDAVTGFSGNAVSLLYGYRIGSAATLLGTSIINGDLQIIPGYNDRLEFGDKIITLDPGNYAPAALAKELADKLNALDNNADTAEYNVYFDNATQNLKIESLAGDGLTAFGGNMVEVNGVTSPLFDNIDAGRDVSYARYVGAKTLSGPLDLTADNEMTFDTVTQKYNQAPVVKHYAITIEPKVYATPDEMVAALNTALGDADVHASVESGKLVLTQTRAGSDNGIANIGGSAYQQLMVGYAPIAVMSTPSTAYESWPKIIGKRELNEHMPLVVADGANDLQLKYDGQEINLIIKPQTYDTADALTKELQQQLDSKLGAGKIAVTVDDEQHLVLTNPEKTGSIDLVGGALSTALFYDTETERTLPASWTGYGTTTGGIVEGWADPQYQYTAGQVTGAVNLAGGLDISDVNNTLSLDVTMAAGGTTTITRNIPTGHKTAAELESWLNANFGAYVNAKYDVTTGKFTFTQTVAGNGNSFTISSSSLGYALLAQETTRNETPNIIADYGWYSEPATFTGSKDLTPGVDLTSATDTTLRFVFEDNTSYSVVLDKRNYANAADIAAAINEKLTDANLNNSLTASLTGDRLMFTYHNEGAGHTINVAPGPMYEALIQGYMPVGASYDSGISSGVAHALGTRDLTGTINIEHGKNDVLSFFLDGAEKRITIAAGSYDRDGIIAAVNAAVQQSTDSAVKNDVIAVASGNRMVLVYDTDTPTADGAMNVINRVGGTAAYYVFYNGQGTPEATYVRGQRVLGDTIAIDANHRDLQFYLDNQRQDILLDAGEYTQQELVTQVQVQLDQNHIPLIASIQDGRLQLQYQQDGRHEFDRITGDASTIIFYDDLGSSHDDDTLRLQVGANSGNQFGVEPPRIHLEALGIEDLNVLSSKLAQQAICKIDHAITVVSRAQSRMGAYENALGHIAANVANTRENETAAESRIRDVEMAQEMMNLTKSNIIQQAAQAMLAQVNLQSQYVLQLLK